jgi:hypothetical protein
MRKVVMRSAVLAAVLLLLVALGTGTAGAGKVTSPETACAKLGGQYAVQSLPGDAFLWACVAVTVHGPNPKTLDVFVPYCTTNNSSVSYSSSKPVLGSFECLPA